MYRAYRLLRARNAQLDVLSGTTMVYQAHTLRDREIQTRDSHRDAGCGRAAEAAVASW